MKSQTGQQIITIHIFPNILRSKGNQAMEFGQLIKYNVRKTFSKNHAANETGRMVSDLSLFFFLKKKALIYIFNIFFNSFNIF